MGEKIYLILNYSSLINDNQLLIINYKLGIIEVYYFRDVLEGYILFLERIISNNVHQNKDIKKSEGQYKHVGEVDNIPKYFFCHLLLTI